MFPRMFYLQSEVIQAQTLNVNPLTEILLKTVISKEHCFKYQLSGKVLIKWKGGFLLLFN